MATWAQLTQQQRDEIGEVLRLARDWSGMMARLNNLGSAINASVEGDVPAFLSALSDGEIPVYDATKGEQALTKADLVNVIGHAQVCAATADNVAGSYNSNWHRALYTRAAGAYNTLQQGRG